MRKTLGLKLFAASAALLTVAACGGGGGGDRPSTNDIANAIQNGKSVLGDVPDNVGKSVTDCMAKVLHDSDLSDKTLEAFVKGDKDYTGSKSEEKNLDDLESQMKDCASKAGN